MFIRHSTTARSWTHKFPMTDIDRWDFCTQITVNSSGRYTLSLYVLLFLITVYAMIWRTALKHSTTMLKRHPPQPCAIATSLTSYWCRLHPSWKDCMTRMKHNQKFGCIVFNNKYNKFAHYVLTAIKTGSNFSMHMKMRMPNSFWLICGCSSSAIESATSWILEFVKTWLKIFRQPKCNRKNSNHWLPSKIFIVQAHV